MKFVPKVDFYAYWGTLWVIFFWEKNQFIVFVDFELKFLALFLKLTFHYPDEQFELHFYEKSFSYSFLHFAKKFWLVFTKLILKNSRDCFGRNFFSKKVSKILPLIEIFWLTFPNSFLTCSHFDWNFILRKVLTSRFCSTFGENLLVWVLETDFCVSREQFGQ